MCTFGLREAALSREREDGGLVILNPVAGGGTDTGGVEAWVDATPGMEVRVTDGPDAALSMAREAVEEGWGLVVAAGGDGTVHDVVNGLMAAGGDVVLGIVPIGTGNDLVRSLGIPEEPGRALELLSDGASRPMDLIRVTLDGEGQEHCVNAVTGGFSGQIHEAINPDLKRLWGPLSYLRSALETWGEMSSYAVDVTVDGHTRSLGVLNIVVANGGYAGGGLPVAPHADPFDGRLETTLILEAPALELSLMAPALLREERPDHEAFLADGGRRITIESDPAMPLSIDGERTEASSMRFELVKAALEVVTGKAGS